MTALLIRASAIWFAILIVAILNGAFRQGILIPRLGDAVAHIWSTLMLSAAVIVVAWLAIRWIGPVRAADCWTIGLAWVLMTLAFEFVAGHYLFGKSWPELLADYKVHQGRIWPVVLLATLVAPVFTARWRGLLLP